MAYDPPHHALIQVSELRDRSEQLGDTNAALLRLEEAVAVLEELANRHPDHEETQLQLSGAPG